MFLRKIFPKSEIINLLLLSSFVIVFMVFFRIYHTHTLKNLCLAWNLFLATTPYIIARLIVIGNFKIRSVKFIFTFFVWLAFLPNAPYIITDLVHIQYFEIVPVWYDYSKLFLASLTALLWGLFSIIELENYIEDRIKIKYKNLFLAILFTLSAYGIFIGRYLRWNSWDLFTRPHEVLLSLRSNLCFETFAFTFTFAFIQMFAYKLLKSIQNNNRIIPTAS